MTIVFLGAYSGVVSVDQQMVIQNIAISEFLYDITRIRELFF